MWIAFLHYDNDEDEYRHRDVPGCAGTWGKFVNWATCALNGTTIFHCQVFFWHHATLDFLTYSTDAGRGGVFATSQKRFRRGWTFLRLEVSAAQETTAYRFLARHAARHTPFNRLGSYLALFRPVDVGHTAFFCSQLVISALHAAGYLRDVPAHGVTPAGLETLLRRRRGEFRAMRDITNPVRQEQR